MLDINTIDSDISKIDVMQLQRMISMENKIFEDMYRLILYDNSQPNAENNNVVKAYLQSQIKALNHIEKLINKYQSVLDELNKPTKIVEKIILNLIVQKKIKMNFHYLKKWRKNNENIWRRTSC